MGRRSPTRPRRSHQPTAQARRLERDDQAGELISGPKVGTCGSRSPKDSLIERVAIAGPRVALELTTGKQVVLATEKGANVAAAIEAPGVVYAYNTVKGITDIGSLASFPSPA